MNKVFSLSKWIWLSETKVNQYADFVTTFVLDKEDAVLRISADTNYALYLNGKFVYAGQYPDYPHYKIYDEFSVGKDCRAGENVLAVLAWSAGEDSSTYRRETAGLLFEIVSGGEVIASSGEQVLAREDPCYRSGEVEKVTSQLGFSFHYDATREDDWKIGKLSGFVPAVAVEKKCRMFPRPIERLISFPAQGAVLCSQGDALFGTPAKTAAQTASELFLRHVPLDRMGNVFSAAPHLPCAQGWKIEGQSGVYALVDMGEEASGFVCLDFEIDRDAEIIVAFGEHLHDLRVRSYIDGRNFAFTYRAHRGRNRWCGNLRRLGLRYLQICSPCGIVLYDCGVRQVRYPVTLRGGWIEDGLYRAIDENGIRTLQNCMHEHYEDCPWREQALYAMDSRNQMLFGYYVFEKNSYAQANLRLMAAGLRKDGLLELCFPARVAITIPAFSLYFVYAVAENYFHTGDAAFLQEMFPTAEKIMAGFQDRMDANGLIPIFVQAPYWNFYEWKEGLDGGEVHRDKAVALRYDSCLNFLYLYALQQMQKLCGALGVQDVYGGQIPALKQALVQNFYDEERGIFAAVSEQGKKSVYAQLPQALALATDCCPKGKEMLIACLTDGQDLVALSLSNKIWAYEALIKEEQLDYVLKDIEKTFGPMVLCGDKTLYETEGGANDFHYAGSLCHGWSAVPCYIFRRYAKEIVQKKLIRLSFSETN